ncbi:hypothetical protein PR003_g2397 [Phytophthora rubi]|uniref:Uncharacterized protein n=1 Tax=Phytophthora rubi TaxID=129364 RepID=A0A6A3JXT3_9STRA|nr:hypothetical protein PR002_g19113 [Phytophthora rubi]KAE9050549.1 hypothetical protein PR001_g2282 [Phytophthora rubi]KAE9356289.1 hypothetical protein PR003_g2397 [Phytophthora rubi]
MADANITESSRQVLKAACTCFVTASSPDDGCGYSLLRSPTWIWVIKSDSSATLPTVSLAQVLLTLDLSATLPTANPETLLLMLDLGSMPLLTLDRSALLPTVSPALLPTLDLSATLPTVSPELVLTLAR